MSIVICIGCGSGADTLDSCRQFQRPLRAGLHYGLRAASSKVPTYWAESCTALMLDVSVSGCSSYAFMSHAVSGLLQWPALFWGLAVRALRSGTHCDGREP
eukprot:3653600-Amphidinium_carterae.1